MPYTFDARNLRWPIWRRGRLNFKLIMLRFPFAIYGGVNYFQVQFTLNVMENEKLRSCVDMSHTKFLTISVICTIKASETYLQKVFLIYLKFYFRSQTLCNISESIHYYESKKQR